MRNLYLRTYSGHSCICPFFAVFWRTQANGFPRSLILRENLEFIWENQFTARKSCFRWFRRNNDELRKKTCTLHMFFIFAIKSHFTCLCLKKQTFPSSEKKPLSLEQYLELNFARVPRFEHNLCEAWSSGLGCLNFAPKDGEVVSNCGSVDCCGSLSKASAKASSSSESSSWKPYQAGSPLKNL